MLTYMMSAMDSMSCTGVYNIIYDIAGNMMFIIVYNLIQKGVTIGLFFWFLCDTSRVWSCVTQVLYGLV